MNDFDVMMEGLWFFIKIGLMIIAITVIVFSAFVISMFGIGLSELKTGKKFKSQAKELETLMDEIGENAKQDEEMLNQLQNLRTKAKHSQISAGVFLSIFILSLGYAYVKWWPGLPSPLVESIITSDGEWQVSQQTINKLYSSIRYGEVEELEHLLSKNPELIHYRWHDDPSIDILNQALVWYNIDVAKCALRHGAKFDSEEQLQSGQYSIEQFISYKMSVLPIVGPREEDHQMIRFMMEHGAQVTFGQESYHPNALFAYISWIGYSEKLGEEEIEIIQMMIAKGASLTTENMHGQNPLEFFEERVENENQDPQIYHQIRTLLRVEK